MLDIRTKPFKLIISSLLVCLILCTKPIWAQDKNTSNTTLKQTSIELKYKGMDGLWFPVDMAHKIFLDLQKYDLTIEELILTRAKYNERMKQLELKDQRIEHLNNALELSSKIEKKTEEMFNISEDARKEAEKSLEAAIKSKNAWYRHPVLWVTVGVVLTVGLGVGAARIIDASK